MALIACAMLFVSCDTTTGGGSTDDGNKDKENATQLVEVYDAYYSHKVVEGVSNDFWMSFLTDDVEISADGYKIYGTGEFVYFEVFPKTVTNNFPVGKFILQADPKDDYAWAGSKYDMGLDYGYEEGVYVISQGCFAYIIEDDEVVDTKYMLSGYVEVTGTASNAEVFADVVFDDGSKATYYYKGKLKFEDYDAETGGGTGSGNGGYTFDYEPTDAGEYDVTFDYCQVYNNGDFYSTGSDFISLYLNGEEWMAVYDLFAPLGSGEDIYGTYTIEDGKYDGWYGVPSSGGTEEGDTPSFFGTDFTGDGYYMTAYYVVSGTVVIAEDGVTIDATTYYGSKIKASYVGDVSVIADAQVARPMHSVATQQGRRKLVKASAEDMVYFGALKNRVRR